MGKTLTEQAFAELPQHWHNGYEYDNYLDVHKGDINPHVHQLVIGEAGVGKSRDINTSYPRSISHLEYESYIRICPTGISAYSIEGRTIHGYFCLGGDDSRYYGNCIDDISYYKDEEIRRCEAIIIDEVFMVAEDTMLLVNRILKGICENNYDLGGKKLIMYGDNCQLLSVGRPFIDSVLWKRLSVSRSSLPYQVGLSRLVPKHRTRCKPIRERIHKEIQVRPKSIISYINKVSKRCASQHIPDGMTVYYTNADVERYNKEKYKEYLGEEVTVNYYVRKQKSKKVVIIVNGVTKKVILTETVLEEKTLAYKAGMYIMLRENTDVKSGLYNGAVCTVKKITPHHDIGVVLHVYLGKVDLTDPSIKKKRLYTSHIRNGTNWNLAWASTIHKVQGLTLDEGINIYFRHNQITYVPCDIILRLLYVAMTRVRDGNMMYIKVLPTFKSDQG